MLMFDTFNSVLVVDSLVYILLDRTGIVTVAMLAGDIGQSGLVPGRAPVHSISTFYVPGNIVVTNPPPWAPLEGGVKSPEISPLGRPAGGGIG